ncbi:Double-stranded RNA-containing particles stability [Komagataella phaffii CBS 7435]|uniref:Protein necessary for structural stability of L-A double-stranded RNA-containing particles n=2 Tax=Komagataella phaffii TaxID=460519 RepID=C4QZN5_KOMPG|nr:uncharacterized protein PAS_chr2-1_0106 [Komagataella phaffii GS115]AOA63122.1 GQ67_00132T0 [Komagataella phaffii]CAH2448794.1 Double-stranded RNA-containing particles stability [Komagataella phaffii CBS 7435]AOA67912.1 GQ68_01256T0 [Komagataella phaffii GS115]CAY68709.1 Protein necessary for structural stability of L-A double-stranded RNA-containing particles [Komagataella phaffii GS115]CCA38878.1 Double-stranded RNA-containing particles stability [Komagataella phaffii CBS 7435]
MENREYEANDKSHVMFTSLGMFIVDEVHLLNGSVRKDVMGGGGLYATVGARIVCDNPRTIGGFADFGGDMVDDDHEVKRVISSWNTLMKQRVDRRRLTTRGLVNYTMSSTEQMSFSYLTPKKRIGVADLDEEEELLYSKSFHLLSDGPKLIEIVQGIVDKRNCAEKPLIVWEPFGVYCVSARLEETIKALEHVDIFTPNAAEAACLLGRSEPETREEMDFVANSFVKYLKKPNSAIVLRCGKLGSLTITGDKSYHKWFPAYHDPKFSDFKVVDTTGGGNSFAGAVAFMFASTGNWTLSNIAANVASSFVIEQLGVPVYDPVEDTWNGVATSARQKEYIRRYEDVALN